MKKMRSIRELKLEKQRLRMRQPELEKAIQYDWRDIKESLRLQNRVKQVPGTATGGEILPALVTKVATYFARKLVDKVPGHLGEWLVNKTAGY